MARDTPLEAEHYAPTPLSRDAIADYLSQLGFEPADAEAEQIRDWEALQAFVASRIAVRALTRPILNTRLKTYGLDKRHPVRMLIRHVIY